MAVTFQSLGLGGLSTDERLQVLTELWDDASSALAGQEIPARHRELLDCEIAEHKSNPRNVVSWDEVKGMLERRVPAS